VYSVPISSAQGQVAVAFREDKPGNSGCFYWNGFDRLWMNRHGLDAPDLDRG
jgi:hypothetical protein